MAKKKPASRKNDGEANGAIATDDTSIMDSSPSAFCSIRQSSGAGPRSDFSRGLAFVAFEDYLWQPNETIRYHFFQPDHHWVDLVEQGFRIWKDVGFNLNFKRTDQSRDSHIRIYFHYGRFSDSFVGKDNLTVPKSDATMRLDLNRRDDLVTVLHEIGHVIGLYHEHFNPTVDFKWNTDALPTIFGKPQEWIDRNIFGIGAPPFDEFSNWDPTSIMQYPLPRGCLLRPPEYRDGIAAPTGISPTDKEAVRKLYPFVTRETLSSGEGIRLSINHGGQKDFEIKGFSEARYDFFTKGPGDTVINLFEEEEDGLRHIAGDNDSGRGRNAAFTAYLYEGKVYVLNVCVVYTQNPDETIVGMTPAL